MVATSEPGGLSQDSARMRYEYNGPGLPCGSRPVALLLARAPLARGEPEIGLHLVRALEAAWVIDGRGKGRGSDRADAGGGAEPLHRLLALRGMHEASMYPHGRPNARPD